MAKAKLLARNKILFTDNCIVELIIWELPVKTEDRPHGYKYRLYYGDSNGNCIVRYDNEAGKGDHKHIGNQEISYQFINIDLLLENFEQDVNEARNKTLGVL